MTTRKYLIIPFYDSEDPDVPGWKIFMIEGNGGWSVKDMSDPMLWLVEVDLTDAQHEVMIAHPSVTLAPEEETDG